MRIKTWHVELFIDEDGERTMARAVLHTNDPTHVEGHGSTRRSPDDADIPEIGDEVAAARALHDLADELLRVAASDIAAIEHEPVRIGFDEPPAVTQPRARGGSSHYVGDPR